MFVTNIDVKLMRYVELGVLQRLNKTIIYGGEPNTGAENGEMNVYV